MIDIQPLLTDLRDDQLALLESIFSSLAGESASIGEVSKMIDSVHNLTPEQVACVLPVTSPANTDGQNSYAQLLDAAQPSTSVFAASDPITRRRLRQRVIDPDEGDSGVSEDDETTQPGPVPGSPKEPTATRSEQARRSY